uniref:Uncharacterized protein n=1 Tax=Mesocestoides corti TaxID=53468 RepID=A0A5K3EGR3_MESCO
MPWRARWVSRSVCDLEVTRVAASSGRGVPWQGPRSVYRFGAETRSVAKKRTHQGPDAEVTREEISGGRVGRAALISQQSHHPPARLPFPNGIEGTGARGSNPGSYSVSVHGEDAYKLTSAKTQRGINQMISIRGGRACVGEARCSGDNSFTYFKLILPNVARDC